jgi:hypothetical protein
MLVRPRDLADHMSGELQQELLTLLAARPAKSSIRHQEAVSNQPSKSGANSRTVRLNLRSGISRPRIDADLPGKTCRPPVRWRAHCYQPAGSPFANSTTTATTKLPSMALHGMRSRKR